MQRCHGFGYLNIQNQKKFRVGPNRVPKNIKKLEACCHPKVHGICEEEHN